MALKTNDYIIVRKIILVLVAMGLYHVSNAQTAYEGTVQKKINESLERYKATSENVKHARAVLAKFEAAPKLDKIELQKRNVGIGIVLSPDDLNGSSISEPALAPAGYSYKDSKIGLAAVRDPKNKGSNPKLDRYTQTYIYHYEGIYTDPTMEFLMNNEVPAEGSVTSNSKEFIVEEEATLSFVRGDKDWMYIVSIDSNYERLAEPRIIFYAFRISFSPPDIFKDSKNPDRAAALSEAKTVDKKKPNRLYHDQATNDLIGYVTFISEQKPYSENKTFLKYANTLPEKLNRDNVADHLMALTYFSDSFQIDQDNEIKYRDRYGRQQDLKNINHLAAHALADVYMTQKDYENAAQYYHKAMHRHRYYQSSGTTMNKDYLRLQSDVAEAYHESGQHDRAIAHILNVLMNGQYSSEFTNERLTEYVQKEDVGLLKKDIDAILPTIERFEQYDYTYRYTFRDKNFLFIPYGGSATSEYERIAKSDFYRSLETKARNGNKNQAGAPSSDSTSGGSGTAYPKNRPKTVSTKAFYHGGELSEFGKSLGRLVELEQFKNNAQMVSNVASFQKKSEKNKVSECIGELKYIYLYTYVTDDMFKNMSEDEASGVKNIKHIAGHLLADHFSNTGIPHEALTYLLLLESYFKLDTGKPKDGNDLQEVRADLADVYIAIDTKEAAMSYMLAIYLDSGHLSEQADTQLVTLAQSLEPGELNTFMDQLFESLEMPDDTHYNFKMGYFSPKLELARAMNLTSLKEKIKKAKFYKLL